MDAVYTFITSMPIYVCIFWLLCYALDCLHIATDKYQTDNAKHVLIYFFMTGMALYTCHYLFFSGHTSPIAEIIYAIANLCVYPLFYLYLIHLTTNKLEKYKLQLYILFLPAFITLVAYIICYICNYNNTRYWFYIFARICFAFQVLFVWINGSRRLRSYQNQLDNYYSDYRSNALKPINTLIHLFGIIAIMSACLNIIGREWFAGKEIVFIPALVMFVLLFSLGYIANNLVPVEEVAINTAEQATDNNIEHYEYYNETLCEQLEQLMNNEKPYLNSKLTINDLALMIGSNRTYISTLINKHYKMNFAQFINKYRIEEAKQILISADKTDKEAIQDSIVLAGFPSENNFYRIFKQQTGLTPLSWRKQNIKS